MIPGFWTEYTDSQPNWLARSIDPFASQQYIEYVFRFVSRFIFVYRWIEIVNIQFDLKEIIMKKFIYLVAKCNKFWNVLEYDIWFGGYMKMLDRALCMLSFKWMAWARDGMTPSNQFTASLFLKFPRKIIALMFTWLYVFSIAFANVRSRMFRRKWKYLCLFIISVFVFFRTHIFAFVTINVHDFSVFLNLLYSNEWQIQNVCLILMQCLSHSFFLLFERALDLSLSLSPSHMRICNPLSHSIIITFSTIFNFSQFFPLLPLSRLWRISIFCHMQRREYWIAYARIFSLHVASMTHNAVTWVMVSYICHSFAMCTRHFSMKSIQVK